MVRMGQNSDHEPQSRARVAKVRRRPEEIADRIKDVIRSDALRPGDRLPQEKELIDQFKAAKGTVREAMKALETQGLILRAAVPRRGFVAEPSAQHAMEMLGSYFFSISRALPKFTLSVSFSNRRLLLSCPAD